MRRKCTFSFFVVLWLTKKGGAGGEGVCRAKNILSVSRLSHGWCLGHCYPAICYKNAKCYKNYCKQNAIMTPLVWQSYDKRGEKMEHSNEYCK